MADREKLLEKVAGAEPLRNVYFGLNDAARPSAEFPRLILILSGQVSLRLFDGRRYHVQPCSRGEAVFCLDGGISDNLYDGEFESAAMVFTPDHIRIVYYRYTAGMATPLRSPDLYYLSLRPPGAALLSMIRGMTALASEPKPELQGALQLAEAIRVNALSILFMSADEHAGRAFQTWQRINRHIITHPDEMHHRYALAKHFQLTPGYISTLCRTFTGRTLNEHQMILKLQRVTLLLQETNLTLDEIAAECKFSYTSYMIRVYRKHYGCTPGKMRH